MNDKFKFYQNLYVQHLKYSFHWRFTYFKKIYFSPTVLLSLNIEIHTWKVHKRCPFTNILLLIDFWLKVKYSRVVTHGIWASFIFSFLTNSGACSSLHMNIDWPTWFNRQLLKFIHKVYSVGMKTTTNNQPGKWSTGTAVYINPTTKKSSVEDMLQVISILWLSLVWFRIPFVSWP